MPDGREEVKHPPIIAHKEAGGVGLGLLSMLHRKRRKRFANRPASGER